MPMKTMFSRSPSGDVRLRQGVDDLLHRLGFAGQGRLLDAQAGRLDAAGSRPGPRCPPRAARCRRAPDPRPAPRAPRRRAAPAPIGRGQLAQRAHGLLGLVFLAKAQSAVEDDDGHDGDGVLVVAQGGRDDRGDDQDDDEQRGELLGQDAPGALDSGFGSRWGRAPSSRRWASSLSGLRACCPVR